MNPRAGLACFALVLAACGKEVPSDAFETVAPDVADSSASADADAKDGVPGSDSGDSPGWDSPIDGSVESDAGPDVAGVEAGGPDSSEGSADAPGDSVEASAPPDATMEASDGAASSDVVVSPNDSGPDQTASGDASDGAPDARSDAPSDARDDADAPYCAADPKPCGSYLCGVVVDKCGHQVRCGPDPVRDPADDGVCQLAFQPPQAWYCPLGGFGVRPAGCYANNLALMAIWCCP